MTMPSAPTVQRSRVSTPDRIIVEGLVVDTFIGVNDDERLAPQRVRFDVEIETVDNYMEQVRTTGAYVSYADVVDDIQSRAEHGGHIELVETWAETIADSCLTHELVASVKVTVRKLDIFPAAEGVGITIERARITPTRTAST